MRESEAWFQLAELIETSFDKHYSNHYICFLLDPDEVWEFTKNIPADGMAAMMTRFTSHIQFDNEDRFGNPISWYEIFPPPPTSEMNNWRVMACTWLGFEALEEGN